MLECGATDALDAAGPTRMADGASTMPFVRTAFGSPVADDACTSIGSGAGVATAEPAVVALCGWFVAVATAGHDTSMVLVAAAGLKPFPVSDTEGCDAQPPSTAPARPIATTTRPYRTVRLPRRAASRTERSFAPVRRGRCWCIPTVAVIEQNCGRLTIGSREPTL